jgi:putative Ca2+/H+ antiporter (TMEM165/GDT1 family)
VDALLTSFIAAGLGEFGDRTQLFAALLAARFGRPGAILAGLALGVFVHMFLVALGAGLVNDFILPATAGLVVAVAFLFAGIGGFFARKLPGDVGSAGTRPFWTALGGALALEFADKSQFLTFGLAAWTDQPALTAAGATAGVVAACLPAVALAGRFAELPTKPIRIGAAILLLLAAAIVAVNALGLV